MIRRYGARALSRRPARGALLAVVGLALVLLGTGCTERTGEAADLSPTPLLILAATSLNTVMPELVRRFSEIEGTRVDLVLGATGSLAAQIENGSPGDLFFAADEASVLRLTRRGMLRGSSVETYALGRLALVWRDGLEPPASLAAIVDDAYEVVALANPEHAPYGAAARAALQHLGVWDRVQPRVVYGESVAQAYRFVISGNADVAIVARSVLGDEGADWLLVDSALHPPIRHAAAIADRTLHPQAKPFLDFVLSAEGQSILQDHGFGPAVR